MDNKDLIHRRQGVISYVKGRRVRTTHLRTRDFIDANAKRKNRRNRFQHIKADKRYSRSGATQWAPDGFEIKTICK